MKQHTNKKSYNQIKIEYLQFINRKNCVQILEQLLLKVMY